MRTTRWINHSLPQLLQFACILLYVNAAFAVLSLLGSGFGSSAYYFASYFFVDNSSIDSSGTGITKVIVFAAALIYVYAGWAIANEQKRGWLVGVIVTAGAVVLPFVTYGPGIIATRYLISMAFDIALVALLVHPQSRDYQRIWFR